MSTTVVLFTRDLRVYDNPALQRACANANRVVPLFVLDPRVRSSPNRDRFLAQSLADLRASLRQRGGDLIVRRGDPVTEAVRLALQTHATGVVVAADASGYAADRQRRLAAAVGYAAQRDGLAADATSRLSAYLHFGCVSAVAVASTVDSGDLLRQLCWRDFFHQVLAAFPALPHRAYRRGAVEDWDWYAGWLVDADVANNCGNWQWVAGTGNTARPNRPFNAIRQALRFDPDGDYVRRWVPELSGITGSAVHQPWRLPAAARRGYPPPVEAH